MTATISSKRNALVICILFSLINPTKGQDLQCLPSEPVACSTGWLGVIAPPIGGYSQIFAEACMRHDYCYRFGKTTYDRSRGQCDSEFLNNMQKVCNDTTLTDYLTLGLSKGACHGAASAFYGAVRAAGGDAFSSSGNFCEYNGPARDICNAKTTQNQACWTGKFSEEKGGEMRCPGGKAVAGIWCTGNYCDNKNLYCKPLKYATGQPDTKWISEEQPDASFRVDNRTVPSVIVGMKCKGSNCDNIKGFVGRVLNAEPTGAWQWLPWVSEEGGLRKCPDDEFVTGLGCKGSKCDEVSLRCSAFRPR